MDTKTNRKMVDSGVEWIGEMPEGWGVLPLRSLAKIVNGGTPTSEPQFWNGGVAWATPADFKNGSTLQETSRTLSPEGARKAGPVMPLNSILISCRAPVGKVCKVGTPVSFNQGCKGILPLSLMDVNYLFYSLQASVEEMEMVSSGTTFLEISTSSLGKIAYPLPPLPLQQAIANYLDHHVGLIDEERDLISKKIELLKEKRSALIFEMVTGKRTLVEAQHLAGVDDWSNIVGSGEMVAVPTPRTNDPFVKSGRLVDSGVEWIGEMPEGWEVDRVKNLVSKIQSGRTPTDMEKSISENGIPWITISDMSSGKVHEGNATRIVPGSAGPEAQAGDILYSIYATIGVAAGPVSSRLATNQAILSLRPRESGKYMKYALDAVRPFMLESALSNTQANLSAGSVRQIPLPHPPLPLQQSIADFLDFETGLIDKEIDLLSRKSELLSEQRKALIFEAVTGKIEITE